MPDLTAADIPSRDCWHVYHDDVHVGTTARRAGVPFDIDQWGRSCGFYPGCEPGQHTDGNAVDFD
jgi:hypothetical protein